MTAQKTPMIPVGKIVVEEGLNARKSMDQEALKRLGKSIAKDELVQPITVRPIEDGKFALIAGERRYEAAKLEGIKELPGHIVTSGNRRTISFIENLHREDLNKIEEAEGLEANRLYAEWMRQGVPKTGKVCPPRRESESGKLCLGNLLKRRSKIWLELDLRPIGFQDSRHTAATWLDHAKVSPKVISVLMGHKAPKRQPDAAPITLRRYTHVLPGELERARDELQRFLDKRQAEEADNDFAAAA